MVYQESPLISLISDFSSFLIIKFCGWDNTRHPQGERDAIKFIWKKDYYERSYSEWTFCLSYEQFDYKIFEPKRSGFL